MKIKIPLQIIELEPGNYHIIIKGVFANETTGNWVVDTGASKTVFNKNRVEHYSVLEGETDEIHTIGPGEQRTEIQLAKIDLKIGTQTIMNLKVALLDFTQINELYQQTTGLKICGLIGSDFLIKHRAVIDYKRELLTLTI